jgi:UDPglucose 6-dehydrogenase
MRISVVGAGYLGATHAACLAVWGHDVVAVESDVRRLACFESGGVPFHEPGLERLIEEQVTEGRLRFTSDIADVAGCDLHFLCVGTPQHPDGSADLRALHRALDEIAPYAGQALVVGKSTVPAGTVVSLLERPAVREHGVRIAWNPEFLREGSAIEDTLRPDRLVFGIGESGGDDELRAVYRELVEAGVPVVRTSLATAELAKSSANLMLAARISLVNVLAETCERSGADMRELAAVVGLDDRIGRHVLTPGIGYGGGCLPKDSRAFAARAVELGVPVAGALVEVVDEVNLHQRARTVALVEDWVGGSLAGARTAVLGATFKAGTDDLRESPALDVACRLAAAGAQVRIHDPVADPRAVQAITGLEPVADSLTACRDADVVLVLTDWPQFGTLDPVLLRDVVAHRRCLDGRQAIDAAKWREAGWDVYVLGEG